MVHSFNDYPKAGQRLLSIVLLIVQVRVGSINVA